MRICVCGGGAIGHVLAALLGTRPEMTVSVLTRTPQCWQQDVVIHYRDRYRLTGRVARVSDNAATCVQSAQLILLAVPAYARVEMLSRISPFIAPGAWVGCVGTAIGFDIDVHTTLRRDAAFFGMQRTPWVARVVTPGQLVQVTGARSTTLVAGAPAEALRTLAGALGPALGIQLTVSPVYLDVSLAYDNATLHPPRLFSLFGPAHQARPRQGFYRDWDPTASACLLALDNELEQVRQSFGARLAPSAHAHFGVSRVNELTPLIRGSSVLHGIGLPILQGGAIGRASRPDLTSRFFQEDIPYGLAPQYRMAQQAGIATPVMRMLLDWATTLMTA